MTCAHLNGATKPVPTAPVTSAKAEVHEHEAAPQLASVTPANNTREDFTKRQKPERPPVPGDSIPPSPTETPNHEATPEVASITPGNNTREQLGEKPKPTPAKDTKGKFKPSDVVELKELMIFAERGMLEDFRAGKKPAGAFKNRTEKFEVLGGQQGRVLEVAGDLVRVEMIGGNWKGRAGWVHESGLRPTPVSR